ncbi:hypothetical protein [Pseudomonas aeruginosa]|uniref:hypothetical protein n=1 Tax=Pseudomonas aeruginosa TaxID=287 RepID=UPI000CE4F98E|nr:hypothetical protein [Pseudomonas aeruginosa]PPA97522.1 hypothetical protein HV90_18455 [Pseudomonas aeruginosa]
MFKITGLDKLQKNLKDAQRALSELDGELGVVNFDPNDPASIEGAIQSVNRMIDERLGESPQLLQTFHDLFRPEAALRDRLLSARSGRS